MSRVKIAGIILCIFTACSPNQSVQSESETEWIGKQQNSAAWGLARFVTNKDDLTYEIVPMEKAENFRHFCVYAAYSNAVNSRKTYFWESARPSLTATAIDRSAFLRIILADTKSDIEKYEQIESQRELADRKYKKRLSEIGNGPPGFGVSVESLKEERDRYQQILNALGAELSAGVRVPKHINRETSEKQSGAAGGTIVTDLDLSVFRLFVDSYNKSGITSTIPCENSKVILNRLYPNPK